MLVAEKEVLSGMRSHSEMTGSALQGFRCVAVKRWPGVYRVELPRTSPSVILYSGTRCMSSDEASRVNLHRDRKKAQVTRRWVAMWMDQNGPAVAVDSQTCESPGSEDSKTGGQSRLEQRSAHRTSPHDPDAGDTRRCYASASGPAPQPLARESVLRSTDKPPLWWRMRRVRCLCWSWEAVTRVRGRCCRRMGIGCE